MAERHVFQLAGEVAIDLNGCSQQQAIGDARQPVQFAGTPLRRPERLASPLPGRDGRGHDADPGNLHRSANWMRWNDRTTVGKVCDEIRLAKTAAGGGRSAGPAKQNVQYKNLQNVAMLIRMTAFDVVEFCRLLSTAAQNALAPVDS